MEPKKNPKYDVHRKRNVIFNFSLALSLLIVISAFRIAVPYVNEIPRPEPDDPSITYDFTIPVTTIADKTPPPPEVKTRTKPIDITKIKVVDVLQAGPDDEPTEITDPQDLPNPFGGLELPNEIPDDSTFIAVEHKPEPVGGYASFYKTLGDNLRYPKKAIRYNTSGTVFVEFVIDKKGDPQQIKVVRGIGNGCDEEAMRVIGLSRWNPGKQRGKPVKVRMVLPVNFKLQ
jgi:protein TonB